MASPAKELRTIDREPRASPQTATDPPLGRSFGATVVEPQLRHPAQGKSVQELHRLIEEALVLLASDPERGADQREPALVQSEQPSLGAPPGSEIRHRSTLRSRIVKTVIGVTIAVLIGIVPLRHLLTPYSTEAFVNAPLSTVRAPESGRLVSSNMVIGARVWNGELLTSIDTGRGRDGEVRVTSPSSGKIWEILAQPGEDVAAGQEIARVVACTAASVTAAVSENVYDRLSPGQPARFNFYGSSHFYHGTVANLFGHSTPSGSLAISPASIAADAYRVVVSVPGLGAIPDCFVGRRGEVTFGDRAS